MLYPPRHIAVLGLAWACLSLAPVPAQQQWTASLDAAGVARDLATIDRQILEWIKEKRSLQQYIERTRAYLANPHTDHCRALLELREYERQYHWIDVQVSQAEEERASLLGHTSPDAGFASLKAELDFYLVNNQLELDRLSCELLQERQILFALYGAEAATYQAHLMPLLQRYMAFRQKLLMQRIQWQQERTALATGTDELQRMLAFKSTLARMSWWRCWEAWLRHQTREGNPAAHLLLPALNQWYAEMDAWFSYYQLAAPHLETLPVASPLDAFDHWQQWLPPLEEEQARQAIVQMVRHFGYEELGQLQRSLRRLHTPDHRLLISRKGPMLRYGIDLQRVPPHQFLAALWPAFQLAWQRAEPAQRQALWLGFAWLFR